MKLILLSIFIITILALLFFLIQQNIRESSRAADDFGDNFSFKNEKKFETEINDADY